MCKILKCVRFPLLIFILVFLMGADVWAQGSQETSDLVQFGSHLCKVEWSGFMITKAGTTMSVGPTVDLGGRRVQVARILSQDPFGVSDVTTQLFDKGGTVQGEAWKIPYVGYRCDPDSCMVDLLFTDAKMTVIVQGYVPFMGGFVRTGYKCTKPIAFSQETYGVQLALAKLGFDVGSPDGVWGPRTEAALRAFQKQKGLSVSGKLDPATKDSLWAVIEW